MGRFAELVFPTSAISTGDFTVHISNYPNALTSVFHPMLLFINNKKFQNNPPRNQNIPLNILWVVQPKIYVNRIFLADVNSRSRSLYAIADPSVCRLSLTLVRPTQPVEIFGNFFTIR